MNRLLPRIILFSAIIPISETSAQSAVWQGFTSLWNDHNNWLPQSVPNDSIITAILDGPTPAVLTSSIELHAIEVGSTGEVNIQNGLFLSLNGDSTVDGQIRLFGLGQTGISIKNDLTISGTGDIVLSDTSNFNLIGGVSGSVLTTGTGLGIRGSGSVGFGQINLINYGTIEGTGDTWALTLSPLATLINHGQIIATGTAGTRIGAGHYTNNGLFLVNNGSQLTLLSNSHIQGGSIITAGTGILTTAVLATVGMTGVTIDGNAVLANGSYINVNDGLTLNGTLTYNAFGATGLSFNGNQSLTGNGEIFMNGNTAHITTASPGTLLTIGGDISISGIGTIGPNSLLLDNQGTLRADESLGQGDTLHVSANLQNISNGVLTGGTYQVMPDSTMRLNGVNISVNHANILLSGSISNLYNASNGTTSALANLQKNQGFLGITNGRDLSTAGDLENSGELFVGASSTLIIGNNGTLDNAGGIIRGDGTISGDVFNAGTIAPGSSAGTLGIQGDLTQSAGGNLEIEIGGTAPSLFDRLEIGGDADLAGLLVLTFVNDFTPGLNQFFQILEVQGMLTGQFDGFGEGSLFGTFSGVDLFLTYSPESTPYSDVRGVALYSIPEPSSSCLVCILGGLAIFVRRR